MKLSLRRASALQNQIREVISSINIVTTIQLNEFHDVESELSHANVTLFEQDARRQRLLLALYTIRGLVGSANAQSGVDINLAKAAFLDKRIIQLNDIVKLQPVEKLSVIKGRILKIRNNSESAGMYGRDTVSTTVVSEDQIAQTKKEIMNLKRQYQRLMDEVLELNVKTEIPLSDDIVKTLTSEGLL
jgi:hypothetical protein